jgi:hypothetical protein
MTIPDAAATAQEAADRRGDDTHWWKAYRRHSTAPRPPAGPGPFGPPETEIHRAAKKALGAVQPAPGRGAASDPHASPPSRQT